VKYRKKPIIIEAYQTDVELDIETLEGVMHASIGDYIITGINGEKYPCKPDIFEKTYELVKENNYEMSKKTPLQAWERANNNAYEHGYEISGDLCYIIETALKNYEELTSKPIMLCGRTHGSSQALIDTICKNYKEVKITNLVDEKKRKALEIIKEKRVDVELLMKTQNAIEYNRFSKNVNQSHNLGQREYDLLKEILK
jgi:hypothetical protein